MNLLNLAIETALKAGKKIMEVYESDDFDVEIKGDNSPLTKADKLSHLAIISYLEKSELPIISEEAKTLPYEERKDWNPFWMVDPLDGTKEFIKRNGEFTVNIALIKNGEPSLGVIYVPVKKELFIADENGAFKIDEVVNMTDFETNKKSKLSPKTPSENVVVVASRSHLSPETEEFIDTIKITKGIQNVETISAGSSLKLCMIAEGKADVYPRYAPTMEWDVAAGHAICKGAGIKVLQAKKDIEIAYNKQDLLNPWFVVGDRFGS